MKKIFVILILSFSFYCIPFGINQLSENQILSIELRKETEIQDSNKIVLPISIQENVIYFLPQTPVIYKNEILLPIPERNFYLYYKTSNQPEFILTPKNTKEEIQKKFSKFPLVVMPTGIIGKSCITNDYLVFQIFQQKDTSKLLEPEEPENRLPAILYPETKEENISKIYFIKKSELKHKKEENFILLNDEESNKFFKMVCTEENIILFTRVSENLYRIQIYDYNKNYKNLEISSSLISKDTKEKILIEQIEPIVKNNEISFLVEVSSRDLKNFKILNKTLYEYKNQAMNSVLTFSDIQFSLMGITENRNFFLGANEEDNLIIRVYDENYNFIKKYLIKFDFDKNFWKDFFPNREGRFFSSKIESSLYTIIEWK